VQILLVHWIQKLCEGIRFPEIFGGNHTQYGVGIQAAELGVNGLGGLFTLLKAAALGDA
jgi:hypothetical protein